ncbi:MAG: hypothetical protein K0R05_970 [Anaerocolumna sp.]|jgi:hypothetical protein|nr:hypothetical protein [Anaerocolumna sp.]
MKILDDSNCFYLNTNEAYEEFILADKLLQKSNNTKGKHHLSFKQMENYIKVMERLIEMGIEPWEKLKFKEVIDTAENRFYKLDDYYRDDSNYKKIHQSLINGKNLIFSSNLIVQ